MKKKIEKQRIELISLLNQYEEKMIDLDNWNYQVQKEIDFICEKINNLLLYINF